MINTQKKIFIGVIIFVLLVATGIALFFVFYDKGNKQDDLASETKFATLTQNESLNDVDNNIEIPFVVKDNLSSIDGVISIENQNGQVPNSKILKISDKEFVLKAPNEGYEPGDTYKIKILNENVCFKDESYADRRDITISINRPEILIVKQKENVKTIDSNNVYFVGEDGRVVVDEEVIHNNNIAINSLITLPVYDEYGFKTQVAYKVKGINGTELILDKPESNEIFDELEAKGKFEAQYSEEYFKGFNEAEIEEDLLNNQAVQALAAASESKSNPIPKLSFELKDGKVIVKYEIKFPGFFKGLTFEIKGITEVRLGARVDISLTQKTFNVGGIVSYTNKYQFNLIAKYEPTGKDGAELFKQATKKLSEILNEKVGDKQISIKAFQTFIPTPVPLLGFSFDVKINFKLTLKAELQITFTDEFSLEVGVKKDSDGINPYFNKVSKRDVAEVELRGTVEAKLGLEVKFAGSAAGVLKAGVSFEIGVYGKLGGFAKAKALSELTLDNNGLVFDPNAFVCYGFYFETGIYSSLSLFAEVDFKVVTFEAKATLLEVKLPIFSVGYTQSFEVTPESESLVLDANGEAKLPSITVITKDMFSGKTSSKVVESENLKDQFDIVYNSSNFEINNSNEVFLKNLDVEEFEESIELKLHAWQNFIPDIKIEVGGVGDAVGGTLTIEGKRGIWHYELFTMYASVNIHVTKQPVVPSLLTLNYERVIDDDEYRTLHPELTEGELNYNFRPDVNGIEDYQIGRLVKVSPSFAPHNVSYRTLDYFVECGEQYIVGGTAGIKKLEEGGLTYALFRIKESTEAIGNINGVIDPLKEIKIRAVTNGYKGNYSNFNISSINTTGIYASAVPVINYDFSPIIDGSNIMQTAVRPGDEISFNIDIKSVYPSNGTRGETNQENIGIVSGDAVQLSNGAIKVNENAQVGSQIIVYSTLSGVEKQYFLNVIKNSVETVTISASNYLLNAGDKESITALITGKNGNPPTITEALFFIAAGCDYAVLTEDFTTNNSAILNILEGAPAGTCITVFAIIDGQRSNMLNFEISKVEVNNIVLTANATGSVEKGQLIQLSAEYSPINADGHISYFISEGNAYASIDSKSGKLVVSNACMGGEIIKVCASFDNKLSNELSFRVALSEVKYIQFPVDYAMVKDDQILMLDAYVNPDSTEKDILYTIVSGNDFASIICDELKIKAGLSTGNEIVVRATAKGNSEIYAEKMFVIHANMKSMSIEGQYDAVKIIQGQSKRVTVTGSDGSVIENELIVFSVTDVLGEITNLASVNGDGVISISDSISETIAVPQVILNAEFGGELLQLYIDIIIPPQFIDVVNANNLTSTSAILKPNESIELTLKMVKQENATEYDNIELVVDGKANAGIHTELIGFGLKEYSIKVQVASDALTNEKIFIRIKCWMLGTHVLSQPFIITVGRVTERVDIINVPEYINIGETLILESEGYPENNLYKPSYSFADDESANYATLNAQTGELAVRNSQLLIGRKIKVLSSIDGILSDIYTFEINDTLKKITIKASSDSKKIQYIEEYGFYILSPDGSFEIDAEVVGGGADSEIYFELDKIGRKYLNINGNVITVKDVEINNGINATIIAYSKNGVVSNTIVIYIPIVIKSVTDWYAIQDNIAGYYMIANDIDFAGELYTPISKFSGIIDGGGYSLRNITIDDTNSLNKYGLIQENYGIIMNLNIRQFELKINDYNDTIYSGAITAQNFGQIINCSVFSNNNKMMLVRCGNSYTGAISGMNSGYIRASETQIYIDSLGCAAGIVGMNTDEGVVIDCINAEQIVVYDYNNSAVWGIIGKDLSGKIIGNINYGKIFERESGTYIEN